MKREVLICFDMDNTLIHATKAHLKAYQLAFERHGLPRVKRDKILPLFGMISRQLVKKIYPSLTSKEVHAIVRDHDHIIQRETYSHLRPVKGVVKMLKRSRPLFSSALLTGIEKKQ